MKNILIYCLITIAYCLTANAQTIGTSNYQIHYTRDTVNGEISKPIESYTDKTTFTINTKYIVKETGTPVYYTIEGKPERSHNKQHDKFMTFKCVNEFTMERVFITVMYTKQGERLIQFTFKQNVLIYPLNEKVNIALL